MSPKAAVESDQTAVGRRSSSRVAAQKDQQPKADKATPKAASTKPATKKRSAPADDVHGQAQVTSQAKGPTAESHEAEDQGSKKVKTGDKGQLKVGDSLPALTLSDDQGEKIDIANLKKVVLFMYPKANTGGCTSQAQAYRDEYPSWKELGYNVYGLSNDNVTPLKNWKEKHDFEYKLLSDPSRALIGALTGTKSKTIRSHVVVDSAGKLADIKLGVAAKESSRQALEAAKKAF